jgi:outer membrane protein TolC
MSRCTNSRTYGTTVGAAFALLILFTAVGCEDFGAGGTGERVVPDATFHHVDTVQITDLPQLPPAASQPSATQSTTSQPATQPTELMLSLPMVRKLTVENNLDLRVDLLNPTIAKTSLTEAQAQFEALFTTNVNYTNTNEPTGSSLESSKSNDFNVSPGLVLPLQTGGTIALGAYADRYKSNNSFQFLNPYYDSNAFVQITQPLLRGAGTDATAANIRVAFYEYQSQEAGTKLQLIRVLADADRVYWRLYAARAEALVRKQQYDLAVAQLERARRQVTSGAAAQIEVIRAQSGVADSLENIITADNDVRQRQRDLKRMMNAPGLEMESSTILVPITEPHALGLRLDGPHLATAALNGRMEMLQDELAIAEQEANVAFARNDMLPLVLLQYQYQINSLGPTLDDSLTQLRQANFGNNTLSVQVQVPIGNEAARSRLRRALANRLQQLATRDQQAAAIRQEVLDAVDELETNWQRILAARERVALAARTADGEIRQFDQGLRTSTDVLSAQTDLADARSAEVAAVSDYQISQVDIAFATGTLLGEAGVDWQPTRVSTR